MFEFITVDTFQKICSVLNPFYDWNKRIVGSHIDWCLGFMEILKRLQ